MLLRTPALNPLLLVVCLAVAGFAVSAPRAVAQVPGAVVPKEAVGVGLWYGFGRFTVNGAASNASNEVKGYTDVMPRNLDGGGPAIGFSFKSWGINYGHSEFDVDLKDRKADVKQTPGNTTDDVTVRALHVAVTSITVLYQPVRWFYLGYGKDQGTLEFKQYSALGTPETRRISVDNPFYSVGIAVGFDPTKKQFGPIATIFAKIPAEQKAFSGSTQAVGVGLYMGY
jgi:hypothetical protein